ncbi:MAG: hypothetical protein AB8B60_11890 [Sulfitobacter sp.]
MPTYTVTTSNWNSAAFWSAITQSAPGGELDFSGLPSTYDVDIFHPGGRIVITDGTSTYIIGDDTSSGTDVTMGSGTVLSNFTSFILADGDNFN